MKFGIGQSVLRKEDARFLTGEGTYTDDVNIDGQAYVHFLRSPHAHARIRAIDTTDAMNAPGVVAILTGSDVLAADGVSPLPCMASVSALNGDPMYTPPRYVLATDAARYVGEAVAMIIAETPEQAMDAAELIEVDYQALPAVVNTAKAMDADAPQVWPETPFGNNVCVKWENREPEPVMEIFDKAAHVAEINILNNRLMGNPLEPRCAVADYDAKTDTRTLYCPSQGVYRLLRPIADRVFKIPYKKLRIISGDVGGSFGIRSKSYPELIAMVWAVKKLNRPLKWLATRAETMMSDNHARDHVTHAKLALDGNGKIQAMWIDITADMGAYLSDMSVAIPVNVGQRNTGTTYMIPTVYNVINLVFTHRTPVDSYRGAGRPEVVYVMERLMEEAARVTGLDSSEIRKRNYIPADAFPFVNSQGLAIDSGDFLANHDMALKKADWEGFEARRAEARARGKLRGIGIGSFLECSGGTPEEEARIRFEDNGRVSVFAGTFSHGQGHATTFSQIVAERLDVDFDKIDYYDGGDNFVIPFGQGTGGSRSAHMGGSSIAFACDKVIEKAKKIAGHLLQSEPANLTFENGVFRVANGPGSMTLAEVAKASLDTE
ncbi:MAG: xanthine dehydrogenase family protein molybdopterin-binding subunit, partial [Rhodospirillales bacterium]|nr:xanthine dehydrogenase family protein molybdopterin-binding subunit [Rhodospirillales bacterium]